MTDHTQPLQLHPSLGHRKCLLSNRPGIKGTRGERHLAYTLLVCVPSLGVAPTFCFRHCTAMVVPGTRGTTASPILIQSEEG